jgi:alcohol dehydrogenase class IV
MPYFYAPRTIRFGAGTRHELPQQLEALKAKRPLIVSDAWVVSSGAIPKLDNAAIYSDVQPDPTDLNVAAGLELFDQHQADSIVAIGGGSPIDCAKAIRHQRPHTPLIAIPTTAGTGSEATFVMVITDTKNNVKRPVKTPSIMPDAAIVDYELTMSMPKPLTAYVGVDTLTHGIEAMVATTATAMTDPMAESSIRLTHRHLRNAWAHGADRQAREGMSLAALQAGMAFGNSSTALVHGMSRPMGAVFHIPHGLSNAVLLPAVTKFSWLGNVEKYSAICGYLDVAPTCDALIDYLEGLNAGLEIPRLRDICPGGQAAFEAALPKMAADALASGSPQINPRVPTAEEIIELYRQSW